MMKENYKIKLIQQENISSFVKIIRESFKSEYLIPSIYRGEGIEKYIQCELNNNFSPNRYFAAYNDYQILGCAEFKIISGSDIFFLNMIASNKKFMSAGIGKAIMNHAFDFFVNMGFKSIHLDVYNDNKIALQWYSQLGFRKIFTNYLYTVNPSILNSEQYNIYIHNFAHYKILKEWFGFYYLDVKIDDQSLIVGQIQNDLIFRGNYDDSMKKVIKPLFENLKISNIYYIGNKEFEKNPELKLKNKIIRMELKLL